MTEPTVHRFLRLWDLGEVIATYEGRTLTYTALGEMVAENARLLAEVARLAPTTISTVVEIRAQPIGAVLLDHAGVVFQVEQLGRSTVVTPARLDGGPFFCKRDDAMDDLLKHAPFVLLWSPSSVAPGAVSE
jgi:hypothetical protein